MSLSDGDKAEIKEIAREIVSETLRIHTEVCPHWQQWVRGKFFLVGLCLGCGIASGLASAGTILAVFHVL